MITISLCMIVKNEEKNIERCLDSVKDVMDEIIIVDTGSDDRTKELCSIYTDKIYDFEWIQDFSAARNYSYSFASMDYIMWMDADDVLLPEDNKKLRELKETLDPSIRTVMMKYHTGVDSNGKVTFTYYRERLTKRDSLLRWMEPVHEYLQTTAPFMNSEIAITHKKAPSQTASDRNLRIYQSLVEKGIPLSARGNYYYARELKDHGQTEQAIARYEIFLSSGLGWKEDNINACADLGQCYLNTGKAELALQSWFRSFIYDLPRAEICCKIAYYYQSIKDYERSAYWFNFILSLTYPKDSWGFLQPDCWNFIPLIECGLCHHRLGNNQKALTYTQDALIYKPDSEIAKGNIAYYKTLIPEESTP